MEADREDTRQQWAKDLVISSSGLRGARKDALMSKISASGGK